MHRSKIGPVAASHAEEALKHGLTSDKELFPAMSRHDRSFAKLRGMKNSFPSRILDPFVRPCNNAVLRLAFPCIAKISGGVPQNQRNQRRIVTLRVITSCLQRCFGMSEMSSEVGGEKFVSASNFETSQPPV